MTNFEKFKTMSFHQMLEFLADHCDCSACCNGDPMTCEGPCREKVKEWLESEAEES